MPVFNGVAVTRQKKTCLLLCSPCRAEKCIKGSQFEMDKWAYSDSANSVQHSLVTMGCQIHATNAYGNQSTMKNIAKVRATLEFAGVKMVESNMKRSVSRLLG